VHTCVRRRRQRSLVQGCTLPRGKQHSRRAPRQNSSRFGRKVLARGRERIGLGRATRRAREQLLARARPRCQATGDVPPLGGPSRGLGLPIFLPLLLKRLGLCTRAFSGLFANTAASDATQGRGEGGCRLCGAGPLDRGSGPAGTTRCSPSSTGRRRPTQLPQQGLSRLDLRSSSVVGCVRSRYSPARRKGEFRVQATSQVWRSMWSFLSVGRRTRRTRCARECRRRLSF
jgi:hypothetical protein